MWLALAVIVGIAANTRGRNGGGWFLLAVIVSPLIAGLLVLALPVRDQSPPAGDEGFKALPSFQRAPERAEAVGPQSSRLRWSIAVIALLAAVCVWYGARPGSEADPRRAGAGAAARLAHPVAAPLPKPSPLRRP